MTASLTSPAARYFLEVANEGSIAAAAKHLNVAGSAISRQIKILERDVGVPLFVRQPRGMVLTEAGGALADHIRKASLEDRRIVESFRQKRGELEGEIQISAIAGLASSFVPTAVIKFQERHPLVRFRSIETSQEQIIDDVRHGLSDVGIDFGSSKVKGMAIASRIVVPTCAIVSANHPIAPCPVVDLNFISGFPVAISSRTTTRQLIEFRATVKGIHLDIRFESNNSNSVFSYVSQTNAVSFATELSAQDWIRRGDLVAVPLSDEKSFERSIEIKVLAGRTLPTHLQAFIAFATEQLRHAISRESVTRHGRL